MNALTTPLTITLLQFLRFYFKLIFVLFVLESWFHLKLRYFFTYNSENSYLSLLLQLLDEMLDNGFPLATEMNVLQELIKPPNFLRAIANQVITHLDVKFF